MTAVEAEASRITTLQVLGGIACACGVLLAVAGGGGPSFVLLARLPGWPWLYGSVLAALGAGLLLAVLRGRPARTTRRVCLALAGWYLAFGASLAATWAAWVAGGHHGPGPAVYAVTLYAGLAGLHLVQASTLAARDRRERG